MSTLKDLKMMDAAQTSHPVCVSICCLTYNHGKYIQETIEGFLKQKVRFSIEILIHDDASTDGTAEIIYNYKNRFPDLIKPIYQTHNQYSQGISPNRAFNFPRAKGKYIALCEGDDFWRDELHLQNQIDFLENNPEYVICYSGIEAHKNGKLMQSVRGGAERDLSAEELQRAHPISTCTATFRNVLLDFPSDLKFAPLGDLVLWSQLGKFGKGKYLSSSPPCFYRVHSGGIFSEKTRREQNKLRLLTFFSLYCYYLSERNNKLAIYFGVRTVGGVIREVGVLRICLEIFKKIAMRALAFVAKTFRA